MIRLQGVTLRRGTKVLLDQVSLSLQPGEKVGLVGRNGAGKSSLFSLLAGRLHEDAGSVDIPTSWQMSEVSQQLPETSDDATEFVLQGDLPLQRALHQLQKAEAAHDGEAMAMAHAALHDAGQHDARSRAQALILGLGFARDDLARPVNAFSGGWRMRLQLARALMCPSDVLLLDEPTNHLDLDALVWLESWLKRYSGTLIVISHDREFLDSVTRVTVHIEDGCVTRYGGSYSTFEETRAQQIELQQLAFAKQQNRIAHLQSFIDRFKAKATKAKQAQSRMKALERMERIAPVVTAADFDFEFREPDALPNPMVSFRGTDMGYVSEDGQKSPILKQVQATILAGQRIGLLGANGQGKSTWVKTLASAIPALSNPPTLGKGLTIGYFAQQELDILDALDTPLSHMLRIARAIHPQAREQDIRNFLGSFRFMDDMVNQPIEQLSGGEKARLALAGVVWQRPNLLLLDEPTNHLDLMTREALAMALNSFEGTVILVSHDRALLRSVCDDFWLVSDGHVQPFDGDLDDYQQYLLERTRSRQNAHALGRATHTSNSNSPDQPNTEPLVASQGTVSAVNPAEQRRQQAQKRQALQQLLKPMQKQLEQTETEMTALQTEQADLHQKLNDNLVSAQDMAGLGKRLREIEDRLSSCEEKWLELSEQIEAATLASGI